MKTTVREEIKKARRIVLKIGSSIITDEKDVIDESFMKELARQVYDLVHREHKEIVIVTSGAVAAGMMVLGLDTKPKKISEKQAVAACGQGVLISKYSYIFKKHGLNVAQILLTSEDIADRNRYLNAKNTLENLIERKNIIPVINENDTVVTTEIRVGDNDNLSAEVACLIEADLLIILSDVDGFYDKDPREHDDYSVLDIVPNVDKYLRKVSDKAGSAVGTGGIYTKLQAAKKTMTMGIPTILAKGKRSGVLNEILNGGKTGTLFYPEKPRISHKKYFIAYNIKPKGKVWVDSGAADALLKKGKSLLPSGVTKVAGSFKVGDVIEVLNASGSVIARGLSNYSSLDVDKLKGKKTSEIEKSLGYRYDDEIIHRNNMVITTNI